MANEFTQAEERFRALRADLDAGYLTPTQFDSIVLRLTIRDAQARYWRLDPQSGGWLLNTDKEWLPANPHEPPSAATPALSEEGRASRSLPGLPEERSTFSPSPSDFPAGATNPPSPDRASNPSPPPDFLATNSVTSSAPPTALPEAPGSAPEALPSESTSAAATTFEQAEDQYYALRGRLATGRLPQAEFEQSVRALVVRDALGRGWQLDAATGRWQPYEDPGTGTAVPSTQPAPSVPNQSLPLPMDMPERPLAAPVPLPRPDTLPRSNPAPLATPPARSRNGVIYAALAGVLALSLLSVGLGIAVNRGLLPLAAAPTPGVSAAATAALSSLPAPTRTATARGTAGGTPTVADAPRKGGTPVAVVTQPSTALLAPEQFAVQGASLARDVAGLNRAELKLVRDANAAALDTGSPFGGLALPLFAAPSPLDADLREIALRAAAIAQNATALARAAIAQRAGSAQAALAAKQTAEQYTSIARWSYALLISAQNARDELTARTLSPADAARMIAGFGARLWNPAILGTPAATPAANVPPDPTPRPGASAAAPNSSGGSVAANPFLPYVNNSGAIPAVRLLSAAARAQVNAALGPSGKLNTWVATTKDSVDQKVSVPEPRKPLADPLAPAWLAALTTTSGQQNSDAARQTAAAELALLSGVPQPTYANKAPQTVQFAAKEEMALGDPPSISASPLPAVDNGVASAASDGPAGDSVLSLLGTGQPRLTLLGQAPLKPKDADVTISIQNVTVGSVDRSAGGTGAKVAYSFQVTWLANDNELGYYLRCGTGGYQLQKGPSGIVSFQESIDVASYPAILAIHCDAVDELGRDGEELGRGSATFLAGDPAQATTNAQAADTASAEGATATAEIENGEATAAIVDAQQTAQAQALQTVEAQQTEQAVGAEVAATQTADARAAATARAAQTAAAVANNKFTLVGTFSLRQGDAGCRFSTEPSTVGKLTINIDYNAGTASGTLDGGGGGRRSGLFCPGSGSGDMVWSYTVSGSFSGSVDAASGALNLKGTINSDNPYHYENCKNTSGNGSGCPSGGEPNGSLPLSIHGTVSSTSRSGKGTLDVTANLPTSGDWSAGQ